MEIFVFFVPEPVSEHSLRELFRRYGQVKNVRAMIYKSTGKHTGRYFVDMPNDSEAEKAIAALNGIEFRGHILHVEKALTKAYIKKE